MLRCGGPGGSHGAVGLARAGHTRAWGCRALRSSGWLGCPVSSNWTSWVRAPMSSTLTSDCSDAGERLSAPEDFSAGWCWAFLGTMATAGSLTGRTAALKPAPTRLVPGIAPVVGIVGIRFGKPDRKTTVPNKSRVRSRHHRQAVGGPTSAAVAAVSSAGRAG